MPTLQQLTHSISTQKSTLDTLRPISSENMLKIRQKFQLEFNYHSNHLEGNSLTIQETYSMLMNSISPRESKPLHDIDEMRGHIKTVNALGLLEDVVKDKKEITESLVRDLNKMILVENFKKRRQDENGDDVFVDIIVGQYKTRPNSVMTATGEMFRFADPSETAALMRDLINWYNSYKDTLDPLELAAMFHYKFIRIHPFDDGNGRVARILMNLILQNNGFPIVIIPSDEKNKEMYYQGLMQIDSNLIDLYDAISSDEVDLFEPFISYIGARLEKSLDWMIRGAQGEDISDVADIVKEAKLWSESHIQQNKIQGAVSLYSLQKTEQILSFVNSNLIPALNIYAEIIVNYYKPFFESIKLKILIDDYNGIDANKQFIITTAKSHNNMFQNEAFIAYILELFKSITVENLDKNRGSLSISINLEPINSYKDIKRPIEQYIILLDIYLEQMSWYFSITIPVDMKSKKIYYKTEPNEDYKEAIKEPLRELSNFLKEKLS